MSSAHHSDPRVVPFRDRTGPGPDALPGIEGCYVLSPRGRLGRFDATGRFVEEPGLSDALAAGIDALTRQYRTGDVDDLCIGLVSANTGRQPWRSASLTFADATLRQVFRTGKDPRTPLTAFQKRNKVKSLYQGLEMVLDAHKTSEPGVQRFYPVLFTPAVDAKTLRRRYGVEQVEESRVLEVLNLLDSSMPDKRQLPALSEMVKEMRRACIAPERRRPSELMLLEESGTPIRTEPGPSFDIPRAGPWSDQPEDRSTGFNDGDPVSYWLLAWYSPFNELNDMQRQLIARGHSIVKKSAGTTLIERGARDDVSIYLIEGTLELEAFDGRAMTIVGGTRRAHLPISQLSPHAYTVKALTDVTVILFSQERVRQITLVATTYKSRPGIEVTEDATMPDSAGKLAAGSGEAG